jgi:hypothetical protein
MALGTLTAGMTRSRLLTNSQEFRDKLVPRNLYNIENEYNIENTATVNQIVNSVNSIIGIIAPFKSFNLKNTVFGRLITYPTPLTEIGLIMLGKQFAYNAASHLAQQTFPVIKLSNLFDGNKDTKVFTNKIDLHITRNEDDTTFENFIDKIWYKNVSKDYPFNKDADNAEYIRNTGVGQLSFLYQSINQNVYKSNERVFIQYGDIADKSVKPQSTIINYGIKRYFNFDVDSLYPYINYHPRFAAVIDANNEMIDSRKFLPNDIQGYAPSGDYIRENFGRSNKSPVYTAGIKGSNNEWIDPETEFSNDNIRNKLVWGRDGVLPVANKELAQLHGDTEEEINNLASQESIDSFNIRTGLLEYTRNLLNATEGTAVDITRKAFKMGDKLVGFNGSGLWRANGSTYALRSGTAWKQGIRQHSVVDQYDRFTKAIRFNGNYVYGGNPNSVIYKTVMPRIHPTMDEGGKIDNKNLMFSIENLAVGVISKGDYGIMDDEYGSPLPLSEVGPFNGRIMWFPPYNIEIVETSSAKFESTVMVGRNEPMYNYQNSERSGTISFTLLVDYPPQLRNYRNSKTPHKDIAEFFQFGGDPIPVPVLIEEIESKIPPLDDEIEIIKTPGKPAEPEIKPPSDIKMVFPNDYPTDPNNPKTDPKYSNPNTIFDIMYKEMHYEITKKVESMGGGYDGLNQNIYYISGLTQVAGTDEYILIPESAPTQYNQPGIVDQFGQDCFLNKVLKDFYGNEDARYLWDVVIHGAASKLYTEKITTDTEKGSAYNEKLGKRRAEAAKALVEARLKAIFQQDVKTLGITVRTDGGRYGNGTEGDYFADPKNGTAAAIPSATTKNERYAIIHFQRNSNVPKAKEKVLTAEEKETIKIKGEEKDALLTKLSLLKRQASNNLYNERTAAMTTAGGKDTGILSDFKSVNGDYFYPIFHTQTPEDFHRRLTFLQQCLRQGSAKRFSVPNDNGDMRARNSVFGRQPICILRIGDFFYTKIIIESLNIDYNDTTWDMNPEGFGMQPMMAKITLNVKIMGGQSLKGPIDALQNAVSFNYYANSTFSSDDIYALPSRVADNQESYMKGVLQSKQKEMTKKYGTMVGNNIMSAMNSMFKLI